MNALSMIQRCGAAQSGLHFVSGIEAITVALRRIVEEGAEHNFLILRGDEAKNYYVQFAASRGETTVRAEAVSNLYLEPAHMLSPRRSQALLALGWTPPTPGRSPNFYRDWDVRDEQTRREMARLAIRTLVEIYGLEPTERVWLKLHVQGSDAA